VDLWASLRVRVLGTAIPKAQPGALSLALGSERFWGFMDLKV